VTVENAIDNPQDTGETGLFKVNTYDASNNLLDTTPSGVSLSSLVEGSLSSLAFTPD